MKRKSNIIISFAAMLILASCGNEAPFGDGGKKGVGEFRKSALTFDVPSDEVVKVSPTRAEGNGNVVDIDDFNVVFRNSATNQTVVTYKYGEMPEVVTLEEGVYQVIATYGENRPAALNSPYFEGRSSGEFQVKANEIVSDLDVIKCKLSNVKVSVVFDPILKSRMSEESYVEVKLGENSSASINLTPQDEEVGNAAYFKKDGEISLVATFHGSIDGSPTSETKSMTGIEVGNHYRLTFKLHNHAGEDIGGIGSDVTVDASVTVTNIERKVEIIEDELLDDSDRPKEDDPEPDPGPDDPNPDDQIGPKITAEGNINLQDWNENPEACVLQVHSNTGITAFEVEIKSERLSPEELSGVGLASCLDLIKAEDPDGKDLSNGLSSLGFPIKDQVLGQKDVTFDITKFMPMLKILGMGEGVRDHIFVLNVSDSEGTNTIELKIRITD